MATPWDVKDLERWDARIREKVQEFGLDCYPQEFEICDHVQKLIVEGRWTPRCETLPIYESPLPEFSKDR